MFNVENAAENICVNPAFFFLASDNNQKSVIVRKACKNRLFGTFWWSARHFTVVSERIRCADQSVHSVRMNVARR